MTAADWVDRVVAEKADLDARLSKLREFMATGKCFELAMADRVLLVRQERAMSDYSSILAERLYAAGRLS